MVRVGLSGGIGSGKSTVATRLAGRGATVIDADAIARDVLVPDGPGLAAVVEEFGPGVLDAHGALDRAALAAVVFADPERRAALNAIVHPLVTARTAALLASASGGAASARVVVHDVPLLVENGLAPSYALVVVVTAPVEVRLARLVAQRGLTEVDARARIAAQASDEQRAEVADVLLDNTGTRAELDARVDRLWEQRIAPFAANLAAGRP
ncbi:MAG: dephospho-CoA kinase, partial [Actinomycetes bacterium]